MVGRPLDGRRADWLELYSKRLPAMALSRAPAQEKWPVTLDHCFGRIILDNVIGLGQTAWTEKIKGPAIKTMTIEQVEACIALGEKIAAGKVNLIELDERSLAARGKKSKQLTNGKSTKRKHEAEDKAAEHSPLRKKREARDVDSRTDDEVLAKRAKQTSSLEETKHLIEASSLTPFRKNVLLALCQVPRGKYTTYAAISDFLNSSARAVGNAMRNNPFAPTAPCHRVLAADGKIGGFGGQWGEGNLINEKIKLLREEGLKFDGKGKVVGSPWKGFS